MDQIRFEKTRFRFDAPVSDVDSLTLPPNTVERLFKLTVAPKGTPRKIVPPAPTDGAFGNRMLTGPLKMVAKEASSSDKTVT
jgi:hypothetical protein